MPAWGTIKFLLSVAVAGVLFPYGRSSVAAGRGFPVADRA